MTPVKIVFMGTPEFAAASLRALLEKGYEVSGVWTRMDAAAKRGMKLLPPPVKVLAQAHGLPVFQPKNLRGAETLEQLRALAPDVIVVAAYGRLLPPAVLALPRLGCVNVHASLLPKYRGASPISAAILGGERETGITVMHMAEGLDTGPMLLQRKLDILPDEPFGSLHDRLAALGAEALLAALPPLARGELPDIPQDDAASCYAPVVRNEDCRVDFTRPVEAVARQIRAYDPAPGAFAQLGETRMKLFGASACEGAGAPGTILGCDKKGLRVACGTHAVRVAEVQAQGGKRLPAQAFFNGHRALLAERFC